eukprot:5440909-Pyramimonas_sp.AAC.1
MPGGGFGGGFNNQGAHSGGVDQSRLYYSGGPCGYPRPKLLRGKYQFSYVLRESWYEAPC